MAHKINSKEKMIHHAYGVTIEHMDIIGEKLAAICTLADQGEEPAGFVAKSIQDTFSKDDLEIIATMFAVKIINEENSRHCNCDECKASRAESPDEDDIISALKSALGKQFPNMEATILKMPKDSKGKTDC